MAHVGRMSSGDVCVMGQMAVEGKSSGARHIEELVGWQRVEQREEGEAHDSVSGYRIRRAGANDVVPSSAVLPITCRRHAYSA